VIEKWFWSPYYWLPKMGFGRHLRNLDHWVAIEIFWSLVIKFGKGTCNMFLENFCQVQCVAIEGNQKLKIWLPMIENNNFW